MTHDTVGQRNGAQQRVPTHHVTDQIVAIGTSDSQPAYTLSLVQGIVRTSSGRIIVGDGASGELRVFDERGRFLSSAGGKGEGPGEFTALAGLGIAREGRILAWDARLQRITEYSPALVVLNTRHVDLPIRNAGPLVGILQDGMAVVPRPDYSFGRSGMKEQFITYLVVDGRGSSVDSIAHVLNGEMGMLPKTRLASGPLFQASASASAAGEWIAYGDGTAPRVTIYSPGKGIRRVIRWIEPVRPVRRTDFDTYAQARIAESSTPDERRRLEAYYAELPQAKNYPFYDQLVMMSDGTLLVRRYTSNHSGAHEYIVFGKAGEMRAFWRIAGGKQIVSGGAGFLNVIAKDADGVESVEVYRSPGKTQ